MEDGAGGEGLNMNATYSVGSITVLKHSWHVVSESS